MSSESVCKAHLPLYWHPSQTRPRKGSTCPWCQRPHTVPTSANHIALHMYSWQTDGRWVFTWLNPQSKHLTQLWEACETRKRMGAATVPCTGCGWGKLVPLAKPQSLAYEMMPGSHVVTARDNVEQCLASALRRMDIEFVIINKRHCQQWLWMVGTRGRYRL